MQPAIRVHLADLKDKAETLPRKANEDAGSWHAAFWSISVRWI